MSRLLVDPELLRPGLVELDGPQAHYLRNVLRVRSGTMVTLFDGAGFEAEARVCVIGRARIQLEVGTPKRAETMPRLVVSLVVGLSKGDKLDLVVEKATELGVGAILPALSERAVVRLEGERAERRRQRWLRIAEAAAAQSRRAEIPRIAPVRSLREQLGAAEGASRLLFWEGARGGEGLSGIARPSALSVAVAVGPEGGFTATEVQAATELGYLPLSLGPRVLRAETAAIAAVALVQYAWGDLG